MNFTVIGGGLVGLATALELNRLHPGAAIRVLEKESRVGQHQSTHNSGVLHAGLYYRPGSLKARLAVTGIRRMVQFCKANGVAHDVCGKVVVAADGAELERLKGLFARGTANGLHNLRMLSREELNEIEPQAAGVAAIHVPEEGIADYAGVCAAMLRHLREGGVEVVTSARLLKAVPEGRAWRLETAAGDFPCDFLINCCGLHCDRVAHSCGESEVAHIVPFRGEYYELKPSALHLVRNLIYPVPDPAFPFLGLHFTRMILGGVEAGPNAVLALSREGYTKWKVMPGDVVDALSFPGLWRFLERHKAMAWHEVRRSFSKRLFCEALQRLVPAIQESDLAPGRAGVRAQAMLADGTMVQDFEFRERPNALHVLNAPSPAATASLAIGEFVSAKALALAGMPAAQNT